MSKLLARLSDAARSGVYAAPHGRDILDATRGSDLQVTVVDLSGVAEKSMLLDRIAAALQFPGWFGRNWDALEDCLSDLSWSKARGHVLLLENRDDRRFLQEYATWWRPFVMSKDARTPRASPATNPAQHNHVPNLAKAQDFCGIMPSL